MKLILLFLVLTSASFTLAGNEGGGGGDPIAAKFSSLAGYVFRYLSDKPEANPSVSRRALEEIASDIQNSLHVSSTAGRIEVVDEGSTLFLLTQRSPLYIKISRKTWMASDDKILLKEVTKLMIALAAESNVEEIPLPKNPIDAYTSAYETCAFWSRTAKRVFDLHVKAIDKCERNNSPQLKITLKGIDDSLRTTVDYCRDNCVYRGQNLAGAEICDGYLELHNQNMSDYKRVIPECF